MKKRKTAKGVDKIIVKKEKGIDIDFADDSYSVYFLEEVEDELYHLRDSEDLKEYGLDEYNIMEEEMFPEAEFYEDDN